MIDDLVPRERLVEFACRKILGEGLNLRLHSQRLKLWATNNVLVANLISLRVESQLLKRTRGKYPALFKALEVLTKGVARSFEASLKMEREAIVELAQTEECRNLVRVFFMQERAKKLTYTGPAGGKVRPVARAAVVGAGVMGVGIAQWLSSRGVQVILRDINTEQVAKGMAAIARLYEEGLKRRTFTPLEARAGLDRILPAAGEVPLTATDLVIEAAVEKLDLKKAIFSRLGELARPETVLATNTSALPVSEAWGDTFSAGPGEATVVVGWFMASKLHEKLGAGGRHGVAWVDSAPEEMTDEQPARTAPGAHRRAHHASHVSALDSRDGLRRPQGRPRRRSSRLPRRRSRWLRCRRWQGSGIRLVCSRGRGCITRTHRAGRPRTGRGRRRAGGCRRSRASAARQRSRPARRRACRSRARSAASAAAG